ncbi:MAG: UvrD-helicase domain-containing protein [Acidobacteriota bacterium]
MRFFADLHVHSKYSRATSKNCDLEHLALWAKLKGISVVGTGDFTHPAWFDEIRAKLVPAEPGLFRLRPEIEREVDRRLPTSCRRPMRFLLEVEISTIYKKGDKTRKVHHLIYAAEIATASNFRDRLGAIGNIASDGRPILGLDSRHLLEITLESGPDAYLVPAHIWTPWFSAMGSKSGFDSIDDCYGDLAEHIFAVETGLSSDPPMNWRVGGLDRFTLVSNSDAHSPPMLGREACVFDTDLDYFAMRRALETGEGWGGTTEFFPEEGKYHLDGHRACGVRLEPTETLGHGGRCPSCGKPVTVGVLHRVEVLADRPEGYEPDDAAPFQSLVPLPEVISEIHGVGPKSKRVAGTVSELVSRLGPELEILQSAPLEDVRRLTDPLFAEALDRLRSGRVRAEGGFDGEYGKIRLFEPGEMIPQLSLAPLLGVDLSPPEPAPKAAPAPPPPADGAPVAAVQGKADEQVDGTAAPQTLLDRLDPDQRAAAEVTSGPLLIVAGPGTGKTRTLTHRLAHLVERGAAPERCLAVTFTRRAAAEMAERLADLTPGAENIAVTTFHGLGLDIVRKHRGDLGLQRGFRVADDAVRTELVARRFGLSRPEARRAVVSLGERRRLRVLGEPGPVEPDAVETVPVEAVPGEAVPGEAVPGDPCSIEVEAYREVLREADLVDFEDLLVLPLELFAARDDVAAIWRDRFDHVSIDEYQDIDAVQYRLMRALVPPDGNLCAIGDPDQSIYRFRGADVGFFLRFQGDFPGARTVELGRNYRSQPAIVESALRAIAPATLVPGRRLEPMVQASPAAPIFHEAASGGAEAEFVVHTLEQMLGGTSLHSFDSGRVGPGAVHGGDDVGDLGFDDFAILYRTRGQAALLARALERAGIPFQRRSHEPLAKRDGVRWLLHALALLRETCSGAASAHRSGGDWLDAAAERVQGHRDPAAAAPGTEAPPQAAEGDGGSSAPRGEDDLEPGHLTGAAASDELRASLDLLAPLAQRHGDDLEAFLAALALGAEVDTWDPRAQRVSLLTLHAAKGLEFPVVFVVGCDDGLLPMTWHGGEVDVDEERRLFFVGLTRARSRLVLTRARERIWRGEVRGTRPSPFLEGLEDLLARRWAPARRRPAVVGKQLSLL